MKYMSFCLLALSSFLLLGAAPEGTGAEADLGPLTMDYSHVPWPPPEQLLGDLRATEDEVRGRALALIGVPEKLGSNDFGAIDETMLRYATLGDNEALQAIVGVRQGPMVFGAVAAQKGNRWERIAAFSCWCKYEKGDLLREVIRVVPAPGVSEELVLRASGGGTGIYSQQETRFRYLRGALQPVFTFVSHRRTCEPARAFCEVERRWFHVHYWDAVAGGVLMESHFKIFPSADPGLELNSVRELETAHARNFSCKTYRWDVARVRYVPFAAPTDPCTPRAQPK